MNGAARVVYKSHMPPVLSVRKHWREFEVSPPPRILNCAYCVLVDWEHDSLAAPFWRLYWNDSPGAYLLLPRSRLELGPGKVVLIPPHTVFGTGMRGTVGHLYVHFTLGLDRATTPGPVFVHKPAPLERALLRKLVQAAAPGASTSALETTFKAQALLSIALSDVPREYWGGRLTDARISRALELLSRPGPEADNREIAQSLGVHPRAFIRLFHEAIGHTPHQYRLRLRIERAAALLREGLQSIDQIATATGFCDRFHFSRLFKRQLGVSPARYRARSLGELPAVA